jgi:DNA-binding CsgD family transcriptional regulator
MKSQRAPSQTRGREAIESMTRPVQQVGPRGLVLKALLDLQRLGDLSSSRLVSRVTDHDHIVALIRELMDSTKHELLNMLAGGPHPPELFDPAKAFDIRTMSRVSMRMLYTPNTAVDPHNGSTLRDYAAAGGHVGVVMHVPYRVTVSDRACAVIPIDPRGSGAGALVVREPTIVASLVELFRSTERRSIPLSKFALAPPRSCDAVDREVLQALTNGMRDEAAATQLSVSLRTYRRHVAQLLRRLGADTRFQAAVLAVEHGWI